MPTKGQPFKQGNFIEQRREIGLTLLGILELWWGVYIDGVVPLMAMEEQLQAPRTEDGRRLWFVHIYFGVWHQSCAGSDTM